MRTSGTAFCCGGRSLSGGWKSLPVCELLPKKSPMGRVTSSNAAESACGTECACAKLDEILTSPRAMQIATIITATASTATDRNIAYLKQPGPRSSEGLTAPSTLINPDGVRKV